MCCCSAHCTHPITSPSFLPPQKKKKAASATSTPATSGKSAVSGASSKKKSSAKEPVADKAALLAKTPASAKDVKALARALRTAK